MNTSFNHHLCDLVPDKREYIETINNLLVDIANCQTNTYSWTYAYGRINNTTSDDWCGVLDGHHIGCNTITNLMCALTRGDTILTYYNIL